MLSELMWTRPFNMVAGLPAEIVATIKKENHQAPGRYSDPYWGMRRAVVRPHLQGNRRSLPIRKKKSET